MVENNKLLESDLQNACVEWVVFRQLTALLFVKAFRFPICLTDGLKFPLWIGDVSVDIDGMKKQI
jgi:hypothetical protein